MDFTDFDSKFYEIVNDTIPELGEEGTYQAAGLWLKDAIMEEPRAPHKTGHLWRSQLIEVIKNGGKIIGVELGFNVPYAARLHEAPYSWNWTLDGSGPKFLEAKGVVNKNKYVEHAANHIRKNQGTV